MSEVVIVSAVRTPIGKRGGALRGVTPVRLGATVVCEALARAGLTLDDIDLFEVNEAFATIIAMWRRDGNRDDY